AKAIESDDSVPVPDTPGTPSEDDVHSGNDVPEGLITDKSSEYAPPEQPESRDGPEDQMIEVLINREVAAPALDDEEPRGPEDDFSSQTGPEQPEHGEFVLYSTAN
ncbi:hypothetical protein FRC11_000578, partial [Ceratobasidium sp. 423]